MKKISIMIVDDHNLIREAVSYMLRLEPNFDVIAATGDCTEVIEIAREKRPDILLLDINMPPCSGFDMIKLLRKNSPLTKIIGLSMHTLPSYVKKMLRLGAKGYLTKNSTSGEMTEAINQVYAGNIFICSEVKNILSNQMFSGEEDKADINVLSDREIQVIRFLKEGQSSKQIAGELKISSKTVEVHRHHILKKLKLKNTASVVSYLNAYAFDF
ncbi:MAG TPA: response regulator transcription factor [Puia sp.]|jgi:two-component system invasion response regulator UvrY|nr:response regulator transcription factor [Puia sp.]